MSASVYSNHWTRYFSFLNFQFPISGVLPLITVVIYSVISWKLLLMRKKIAIKELNSHGQKLVKPIVDTKISKLQSILRAIFPYQSIEKSSVLDLFSIYVSNICIMYVSNLITSNINIALHWNIVISYYRKLIILRFSFCNSLAW